MKRKILNLGEHVLFKEGVGVPQQNGPTHEGRDVLAPVQEGCGELNHIGMALEDIRLPRFCRDMDGTTDLFKAAFSTRWAALDHFTKRVSISVEGPLPSLFIDRDEMDP